MKQHKTPTGVVWYLCTIQYCTCLFAGGAIWFLTAHLTGFFWDDHPYQIAACLVLIALIIAESLWAPIPGPGNELADFAIDLLTSAAIAAFGMAVVPAILSWLHL